MRRSLSWPQLADPFPSLDMEEEVAREEQQGGGAASGYPAYSYRYSKDHTKVLYTSRRSLLHGPTVHSFDGGGLFVSQRHGVFYSVDTEEEELSLPASVHRHILTSSRVRHLGTVRDG